MAYSSPLTGEYLRAFERHATKNDPKRGGATVPCWEIVAYAADILDIAARKLGDNLDMCRLAYSLGIDGVIYNKSTLTCLNPVNTALSRSARTTRPL